jgi:hypothetical protein
MCMLCWLFDLRPLLMPQEVETLATTSLLVVDGNAAPVSPRRDPGRQVG